MTGVASGPKLLLVEDDMLVAWALEDMLKKIGCLVLGPAANIAEAIAMIDAEAPDAAVLDVNLDGVPSYPVADALTAGGIPFLFATAYKKERLQEGYQAVPVLQKPFERSELREAITFMLGGLPRQLQDVSC